MGLIVLCVSRIFSIKSAMKKSIIVSFCMMLACIGALAQLTMGIVAGPSFANFGGSDVEAWGEANAAPSMQVKSHLGVFFNKELSEEWSIEPRLLYSTKGPKYEGEVPVYGEVTYKKILNYIDIPVLVKYAINENLYVYAGPQLGFLLSAKVDDGEEKAYVKDQYKSTEFAVVFGGGYKITEKLGVNLFYDLGLTKIALYESLSYDVKNNVIKLSLTYTLKK